MSPTLYECLLSFFGWVLRSSFMASILIVLVLILQFLFKNKLEVRWKYLLWVPVAIRLLLPWAPESSLSLYNALSLEAIVPISQLQAQPPLAWHSSGADAGEKSAAAAETNHSTDSEKSIPIDRKIEVSNSSLESGSTWDMRFWWSGFKQMGFTTMLMSVWLLGVLLFAAKTVYVQSQLKRVLRADRKIETPYLSTVFRETKRIMGVKRDVRFVASGRISGPAVVGFCKPAIVISPSLLATLREDQLQCILAHEFGHIQRRDVAVNWIMHILLILHWFNPLLWLAVHKARQDQEMACDACVLDRMSSQPNPQHSHTYGQTIIHVLEYFHLSDQQHHPGLAGLSASHKQIKRRLLMIKRFHKRSYHLSMLGVAIIVALGSVTLVNAKGNDVDARSSAANENAMKTAAAKPEAEGEGKKLETAEKERIAKLLEKNPDDTYIVYVSNEVKVGKGGLPVEGFSLSEFNLMGSPSPRFDTYEAYLKRATALKEAVPQQPTDLPDGYIFSRAEIDNVFTSKDFAPVKAEAKKLGKLVYSKKMNITNSDHISLTYTKGEDFINITSFHWKEKDLEEYKKRKEKEYKYTSAKEMEKKHPNHEGRNYLSWLDYGKSFQIVTNSSNPLTKDELIQLAKTAVLE